MERVSVPERRPTFASTAQYRRLFVACLLALGISGGAAGVLLFVRWHADRAIGADTRLLLDQAGSQVEEALENRLRAFALFRDAMDKSSGLNQANRKALAESVLEHTSYLRGTGWIDKRKALHWWVEPTGLSLREQAQLTPEIVGKVSWIRDLLKKSSIATFHPVSGRTWLVVVDPLRSGANRPTRIVGLFDLAGLCENLLKAVPARVMEGNNVLYVSPVWRPGPRGETSVALERPVRSEGMAWMLYLQSAKPVSFNLSWFRILLVAAVLMAALALSGMIWATERLRTLASTDELTGLHNRRFFLERWEEEVDRAKRYNRDLTCLMIDIDGFKRVNDTLGHQMGDHVLKQAALILKSSLRRSDLLARFGGDEFVVGLPETNLERASLVAEKLRASSVTDLVEVPVHLSVGIAQMQPGDSANDVIHKADANLYDSRRSEREQIIPVSEQDRDQEALV